MKMIYVKWRDAHHSNSKWSRGEILDDWNNPYILETMGWLIETNLKDEIALAMESINSGKSFRVITGIPKKYIIEMKELKWGKK